MLASATIKQFPEPNQPIARPCSLCHPPNQSSAPAPFATLLLARPMADQGAAAAAAAAAAAGYGLGVAAAAGGGLGAAAAAAAGGGVGAVAAAAVQGGRGAVAAAAQGGGGPAAAAALGGRGAAAAVAAGHGVVGRGRGGGAPPRLGDSDKELWLEGNSNKSVPEEKIISTGSPFNRSKWDTSPVKAKNKRLEKIYEELRVIRNMRLTYMTSQMHEDNMRLQERLTEEAKTLKDDIMTMNGMPLPFPDDLKKQPGSRVKLFK